jgi:hypothetical protein
MKMLDPEPLARLRDALLTVMAKLEAAAPEATRLGRLDIGRFGVIDQWVGSAGFGDLVQNGVDQAPLGVTLAALAVHCDAALKAEPTVGSVVHHADLGWLEELRDTTAAAASAFEPALGAVRAVAAREERDDLGRKPRYSSMGFARLEHRLSLAAAGDVGYLPPYPILMAIKDLVQQLPQEVHA